MEKQKLGGRVWTTIITFGLFGQIAWIIENMYFNVYIDRTISSSPYAIWVMVAASAIVATFATLIAGTWSDKIGVRRHFMSIGYIVWGVVIMSFSLITLENTSKIFGMKGQAAISFTVAVVVIMDCVMTYIGSTANDACFNAWVTDNTTEHTRGKAEGVLAVMPLLAMAAVFGGMDWMTQDTYRNAAGEERLGFAEGYSKVATSDQWWLFYVLLGTLVIVVGIIGLFVIKDNPNLKPSKTASFKDMFYGFKKDVIKQNKNLYTAYVAMAVIGIANNAYLAYIIMYVERTLGYSEYIIPVGAIIVLAAIASVVFGIFMDKSKDRRKFLIPTVCAFVVGAILMLLFSPLTFGDKQVPLILICFGGFILMGANLCMAADLTASVRDLTPPDKVGLFQGVRMFFCVLVPMVIGPLLTAIINIDSLSPVVARYVDPQTGAENIIRAYTPYMFLIAAVIGALAVFPVMKLNKASLESMRPFSDISFEAVGNAIETEVLGEAAVLPEEVETGDEEGSTETDQN